jgi:hypothetical protein
MQAARSLFYFPQNAIYSIIVSFSGQIVHMFFIRGVPKFEYQPWLAKGKTYICAGPVVVVGWEVPRNQFCM